MALRILKQSVNGTTGFITCVVRVEEETSPPGGSVALTHGPNETVTIAPQALLTKFHDDCQPTSASMQAALESWLAEHHDHALTRKQHVDLARALVPNLEGKLVDRTRTASQQPLPEPEPDSALPALPPEESTS